MQQSLEQYFINEQSDFYNYLIDTNAFKSPKTYRDYITRLQFVDNLWKFCFKIMVFGLKCVILQRDSKVGLPHGNP